MPSFTFEFSADPTIEDGLVVREGKVFELGNFPDKGFSLNALEADAAIAHFTPVANDLEHKSTILDGLLGDIRGLRRDGNELFGKVAIPRWLDSLIGKDPIKVSLAFDSAKRVIGNALTINPRITDAQVAAAFTAGEDLDARAAYEFFAEFAGRRNSNKDQADLQAVHDLTSKLGATCAASAFTRSQEKPKPMTFKQAFAAIAAKFSGDEAVDLNAEIGAEVIPPVAVPVVPAIPVAQTAELVAAVATANASAERMAVEVKALRESRLNSEAKTFFNALKADRRVVPAQEEAIVASFCIAARDDARGQEGFIEGVACFSAEGALVEGERVKNLRASYANQPQHSLTQELLESGKEKAEVLFTGSKAPMSDARKAELLKGSELGKTASKEVK